MQNGKLWWPSCEAQQLGINPIVKTDENGVLAMQDSVFLAIELPAGITALLAEGRDVQTVRAEDLATLEPNVNTITCAACPLFFDNGDALLVIEMLESIGYFGHLLVVAPKLPNHRMVQTELTRECRKMKVSLISP